MDANSTQNSEATESSIESSDENDSSNNSSQQSATTNRSTENDRLQELNVDSPENKPGENENLKSDDSRFQPTWKKLLFLLPKNWPKRLVYFAIVALFFLLLSFFIYGKSTPSNTSNDPIKVIDKMQKTFPFQKVETWISFLAALQSVTNDEPSQPAVLLFIGGNTPVAMRTMEHVVTTLAINTNELLHTTNSANANFKDITVQWDEITDLTQEDNAITRELDRKIHSILSKYSSVVLGSLEKIPPKAAMILHGYCDNFMAPFKRSVIILTAAFDYEMPRNSKEVERKLHSLWDPSLGIDKSASLVSRVANNVVFIEPETDSTSSNDIGRD
ncbi:uncharacterized protein LOC130693632 [Daphnia carinata]|uniref:uncharacterized protein LOC130693632 n=1 Tax=Daphnia carinata TaxID=120202 RepID=UPI00257D7745|nr:uncharacterized protein LOC130693632 [Daphnia carinata]